MANRNLIRRLTRTVFQSHLQRARRSAVPKFSFGMARFVPLGVSACMNTLRSGLLRWGAFLFAPRWRTVRSPRHHGASDRQSIARRGTDGLGTAAAAVTPFLGYQAPAHSS